MEVCRRRGWGWRGREAGEPGEGVVLPPISPPTPPKASPDWLSGRRAQVTFASNAERGRRDPSAPLLVARVGGHPTAESPPSTAQTPPPPCASLRPCRGPLTPAWTAAP